MGIDGSDLRLWRAGRMTPVTEQPSLAEWFAACLVEDEAAAKTATPGPWVAVENYPDAWIVEATAESVASETSTGYIPAGDAQHIATWDPARVLSEVAAKRRILELHEHVPPPGYVPGSGVGCQLCSRDPVGGDLQPDGWCQTVRLLALPYAGRDGWREEWRPQ